MAFDYTRLRAKTSQPQYIRTQKLALLPVFRQFIHELGSWGFTLVMSLVPFIFVFILFTGPKTGFYFFELFRDNSVFYVCVAMSALSLYYTFGMANLTVLANWIGVMHIITMLFSMVIYFSFAIETPIPLFSIYSSKKLAAWLLLFVILLGLLTLVLSSVKKETKG